MMSTLGVSTYEFTRHKVVTTIIAVTKANGGSLLWEDSQVVH